MEVRELVLYENYENNDTQCKLKITTLGHFNLFNNDGIIMIPSRSKKLLHFLKYLITFIDKSNPPELLLENLFPDEDYKDPYNAVKNMVYRLRKQLKKMNCGYGQYINILHINDCYQLRIGNEIWIDVIEFENLIRKAEHIKDVNIDQAMTYYREAISLYKGEYLPELIYADWVMPSRNHYKRLFLKCVMEVFRFMKKKGMFYDLLEIWEKVIRIEPYEEDLHLYYLDTLVEQGKFTEAERHYRYITSILYKQFGFKPNSSFVELYKRIHNSRHKHICMNQIPPIEVKVLS